MKRVDPEPFMSEFMGGWGDESLMHGICHFNFTAMATTPLSNNDLAKDNKN